MTHYEERLGKDLKTIRGQVAAVAQMVERAVHEATRALLSSDHNLAARTILGDLVVNRETRKIDSLCHVFIARHLPSAGNLRFVSSVLRLSVILERIGDYAETICRSAVQLSGKPPRSVASDIQLIGDQASRMLHQAMESFNELNADMARATLEATGHFTATSDKIFADLFQEAEAGTSPMKDLFSLLATFNRFERIIHQAKNICEETIFATTGQIKKNKKFDVLFLDETNSLRSRFAEAFATKNHPGAASFASAGWGQLEALDPRVVIFAASQGIDLETTSSTSLDSVRQQLPSFELVVSMQLGARAHIPDLPFHTILLEWDIARLPDTADREALEALYKTIAHEVSEIIQVLDGRGRLPWTE